MLLFASVAIAAGVTNLLARNINSILAEKIGLFEGTFFNYITGLFFSALFLLFSGEFLNISFGLFKSVPFQAYLGGFIGVFVVSLSSLAASKISAFYLTLIMFLGQLFTGIVLDYLSTDILSIGKLIGGFLVVLGLGYNLLIDKKISA